MKKIWQVNSVTHPTTAHFVVVGFFVVFTVRAKEKDNVKSSEIDKKELSNVLMYASIQLITKALSYVNDVIEVLH